MSTARVLWADHARIRADFPWLPAGPTALERWLLRHAVVSETQADQAVANTPIATVGGPIEVLRPPEYGRACVVPVQGSEGDPAPRQGLVDVKGCGVVSGRTPTADDFHSNGLMLLDDALQELAKALLLDAVFDHAGVAVRTLPLYALLDLGFDGHKPHSRGLPAAAVMRRAHRRRVGVDLPSYGTDEHRAHLTIELLLRHYGISSAVHNTRRWRKTEAGILEQGKLLSADRRAPIACLWDRVARQEEHDFECLNVQLTEGLTIDPLDAELVDFEQYWAWPRFERPLRSMVYDRPLKWGGVLWPDDPDFVQPDPKLRVPLSSWDDRLVAESQTLATSIRRDDASQRVRAWLDRKVDATLAHWAADAPTR